MEQNNKKPKRIIWIGTAVIVAMAIVMAIDALSINASANIQKTYSPNGSVSISVCDQNSTLMGIGLDVCSNTSAYTQILTIEGGINLSNTGYISNSPICTPANGYCAGSSGVACTALGNDYVLSNTTAPTCIRIIRYDNPTSCTSGNYSQWNGSTFLCQPDINGGSGSGNASDNTTTGYIPYDDGTNTYQNSPFYVGTKDVNNNSQVKFNANPDIYSFAQRGFLDIISNNGGAALSIIRSNTSYVTISSPGGTPFLTKLSTRTTGAQSWLDGTVTGTTYSLGDTIFGPNGLLPAFFVDADKNSICVGCNTTNANLTVNGNATISGRVGIGNSAPNKTLDVSGDIKVSLGNNQIAQLNDNNGVSAIWGIKGGMIGASSTQHILTTDATSTNLLLNTGGTRNTMTAGTNRLLINATNGVIQVNNLTGVGNDYVCVDALGQLYRSDTGCA